MKKQPNISLCMIVKNEEKFIANSLQSVKDIINEMIVVDTGSSDRTMNIAKSFGAKVYSFPWNNHFSDARNYALEKASGDWILILDADEELYKEDRDKLLAVVQDEKADAYYLKIYSFFGNKAKTEKLLDARISLFRNDPRFRYQGAIHEEIISSIHQFGQYGIFSANIRIFHYGYLDHVVNKKNKIERNKAIILHELAKDDSDTFLSYALAIEYLQEQDYENAKPLLFRVIDQWNETHPNYSDVIYKLCLTLKETKEYQTCRSWLKKGIALFADYTDLYYLQGALEAECGNYILAEEAFKRCISMGEAPERYYNFEGVGTYRAWYALGSIYEAKDQMVQAFQAYLMSLRNNMQFSDALLRLIQYAIKKLNKQEFIAFINNSFDLHQPDTYYAIGQGIVLLNRLDYLIDLTNLIDQVFFSTQHDEYYTKLCKYSDVIKKQRLTIDKKNEGE